MIALAALALALALGGVYGVMAFLVGQRTRELGIRLALGATHQRVVALVLRQGTRLTLLGVALGVILATMVSRGLASFLWEVSPFHLADFPACLGGAAGSWLLCLLVSSKPSHTHRPHRRLALRLTGRTNGSL